MRKKAERIEEIGFGELKLIQNPEEFCYGIDAVLLADFADSFLQGKYRAVDLGTGTGIVPIIMSYKNEVSEFVAVEVQKASAERAERNFSMNGLKNRMSVIETDVIDICGGKREELRKSSADMVTSNPPYIEKGSGIENDDSAKFIARQETTAGLEDFVKAAAWLLKEKGHFCMVHRPSRLVDIMYYCRKYRLEPKDIRFVSPRKDNIPNIVLVHCVHGGGRELKIHRELCVYDDHGAYSKEILGIYGKI